MKRPARTMACLLLVPVFIGLVLLPQEAADAAKEGLALCGGVIIPSLFPFFVLSSMAVSLGLAQALGSLLGPVMGPLFRVGKAGGGALALGLTGGYPVGARTVRQLYENGQCSKAEAERLLAFCNNCGPAFILGVAGAGIFGSAKTGALLLAGHVLGACSVGILYRFRGASGHPVSLPPVSIGSTTLSTAFTQAVSGALSATLGVCGYVVLFSVLNRFLELLGLFRLLSPLPGGKALAAGLLELSNGMALIQPSENAVAAMLTASFLMGFGGLAVQCQTLSMLEGCDLNPASEVIGKLLHGCFAALWTLALLQIFPQASAAMAVSATSLPRSSLNWLPLAVTLVCWGIFLLVLHHFIGIASRKNQKKRI